MTPRRLLLAIAFACRIAHAQPSATVGSVRGAVTDTSTREPAAGATIVATSPALQGEQTTISDARGQYLLTALPPGMYVLTIYYVDRTFTRRAVLVQLGKQAVVNLAIDSRAGTTLGEVIELHGAPPLVDQGSTKIGVTLAEDYTRNVPTARTFSGIVGAAAGAQSDLYGISFAGTTSPENTYVVDGVTATDPVYGTLASDLPHEFIAETEVITGGYNAELGRATGGIVNVVTKQGGNAFHGSVFGYYEPGALAAAAKTIETAGGSIDQHTDLVSNYDLGAELGGPIVRDKLWFHVGFNPNITHQTTTRIVAHQVDDDQDGNPDVDPSTGFIKHVPLATSGIPIENQTYYFTAKLTGALGEDHQFQLTAFGNPTASRKAIDVARNPSDTLYDDASGSYNVAAKWTSKLARRAVQVDAIAGFHRNYDLPRPHDRAEDAPLVRYDYERSLYDFRDLETTTIEECDDHSPSDPYPHMRNCPVSGYVTQGLGLLDPMRDDRAYASGAVTWRTTLAGDHAIKAGLDAERASVDEAPAYTGGFALVQQLQRRDKTPLWKLRQFQVEVRNLTASELADPSAIVFGPNEHLCPDPTGGDAPARATCRDVGSAQISATDTSLGAYLQDSWQILPNLTVDAGVRWERQIAYVADDQAGKITPEGELLPDRVFTLDNVAPRIGAIYDPTREGRARLFGHYGRFYENLPLDLNSAEFSNTISTSTAIDSCPIDHGALELLAAVSVCPSRRLVGAAQNIGFAARDLRGQYTDEIIAGAEYQVMADLKVGVTYQHRSLPSVIEDLSTDAGNHYIIANPGESFAAEAAQVRADAARLTMSSDPNDRALAELDEMRAKQLDAVELFDKPVRTYDAIQLLATKRPTARSLVIASYTYSMLRGNFPGLFSTDTGQLDPNITAQYDLPDLMANRYGPLGLDRPHSFKSDAFYQLGVHGLAVTVGASFRAMSGLARTALGPSAHLGYGAGEVYLLPRGALERTPVTAQLDLHLACGRELDARSRIEVFVNVFNVTDQQDELDVDQSYTLVDAVNPVVGGTASDLRHVKVLDAYGVEQNASPTPNKNFGHVTARPIPRAIQLGARWIF